MKRVLSLVLALVLVLGMIPTFAADKTGGEQLFDLGLIEGDNGDLMEDQTLERQEFAKLLAQLNDELEQAQDWKTPATYADVDKIESWAKSYVAYAQEREWMTGKDNNMFDPAAELKSQELLTVLLRILGYDDTWEKVFETAEEIGLVAEDIKAITRGDAFELIWTAVNTKMADSDMTLGVHLGVLEPEAPVVTELAVESVTATNLKEVVVTFNQEVDKDTVVAANFVVKKGTTSVTTIPELQEDGKTVILVASPAETGKYENQTAYTLTVDKVKSESGLVITKVTEPFSAFDGTLPTVESVAYTGPKQIELTFSEPIDKVAGKVTVKSGTSTLSVNLATANIVGWGTNVLQIPLFSTLVDGTSYAITVSDYVDFAGYKNVIKTFEVPYAKDVTPPTASVVKATQEYVVVEFNKPVTGVNETHFAHTFTAWTALKVTADDSYASSSITSGTKFYVWFNNASATSDLDKAKNRPIGEGTTNLILLGKTTSSQIKDLWSNNFADTTLPISVTADKVAPEVKEIKVTTESAFTVEFTKNVVFTKDNVEVLDKDGKAISGLSLTVTGSAKKFTVSMAGKDLAGLTLIVNLKNVKDTTLQANAMAAYNTTIEITDKTAPVIDKVTYEQVGSGDTAVYNIYVFFDENVDSTTALVAGNYQLLNGTTFTKLTNTPEFVNGTKTVKIQLTAAQLAVYNGGANKLFVDNVKDVAGNAIEAKVSSTIQAHNTAIQPKIAFVDTNGNGVIDGGETTKNIQATGLKTVKVYFDQELAEVQEGAFTLSNASSYGMDVNLVDGKTVVTLNLNTAIANPRTVTETVTLNAGKVVNLFGVGNAADNTVAMIDKIAPSVALDSDDDAIIYESATGVITIEFTENLLAETVAGVYANDLVVVKGTTTLTPGIHYTTAVVNNNEIEITAVGGGALAAGTYKVSSKDAITYIKDTNSNKAVKFTDVVELVLATAPVATVTAPVAGARTTLVVTFNEELNASTLAIDDINDLLSAAINDQGDANTAISVASVPSSVVWSVVDGKNVATITIPSTTFVAGETVRINFVTNAVQDLAGNGIANTVNVDVVVAP